MCLTCKGSFYFSSGSCVSQCPPSTFVSNSQCVNSGSCTPPCVTCSDLPSFCLSCPEDLPIVNLKDGTCVSNKTDSCPVGFYVDLES